MIRSKIKQILNEVADIDEDLENLEGLIYNGYLDSFNVLILVDSLEKTFGIKLEYNDEFIEQINSLDSLEELVKAHS